MVTVEASPRLPQSVTQWRREVDRCRAEIASAERLLRSGHPDRDGPVLGAVGLVRGAANSWRGNMNDHLLQILIPVTGLVSGLIATLRQPSEPRAAGGGA